MGASACVLAHARTRPPRPAASLPTSAVRSWGEAMDGLVARKNLTLLWSACNELIGLLPTFLKITK